MAFWQLKLTIFSSEVDAVSQQLEESGALSITYLDAEDQPIYEPPLDNIKPLWKKINLLALYEDKVFIDQALENFQLTERYPSYTVEKIEDKAWEKVCRDQFKPMQYGQNLWIIPSWTSQEDFPKNTHNNTKPPIQVMLDPGLAFGTGSHPTTTLCLEWLANHQQDILEKYIIDYGCGSGILGIAALKLGAGRVVGVDIDPQAILASLENAQKNQINFDVMDPERFNQCNQSLLDKNKKADMIISNILAGPLITLAGFFSALLKDQGQLVLSGILREQSDIVLEAYKNNFNCLAIDVLEDWVRIELAKK